MKGVKIEKDLRKENEKIEVNRWILKELKREKREVKEGIEKYRLNEEEGEEYRLVWKKL